MQAETILNHLRTIEAPLQEEGITLIGLFGSYARDEADEESDIDLLIETDMRLVERHGPFGAFTRLAELKAELKNHFGKNVDLADKAGLNEIGKKHILPEVIHV